MESETANADIYAASFAEYINNNSSKFSIVIIEFSSI